MPIPDELAEQRRGVPREAARRGRRDRRGADGALPRRRGARPAEDSPPRSRPPSRATSSIPVACGVATKNLGTHALLDLIVEGVPVARAQEGRADRRPAAATRGVRLQDGRRPVRRPHLVFRVYAGTVTADSTLVNRARPLEGAPRRADDAPGQGAREGGRRSARRHRRRREAEGRRRPATCSSTPSAPVEPPQLDFPEPVMSFAVTPKTKGDEDKVAPGAAAAPRGGPDAAAPARPADRRAAPLRA